MGRVKVEVTVNSMSSNRGDVIEVDTDTAERMIRLGHAVGVSPKAQQIEEAVAAEE